MQFAPRNDYHAAASAHQTFTLSLIQQAAFSLPDAADVRITCVEGTVWITLDNDPRDIVLEASGVFTTAEHRRAIIYAMKRSQITVSAAPFRSAKRQQMPKLVLQMKTG